MRLAPTLRRLSVVGLLGLAALGPVAAEDYRLQPGDTVRFAVAGLPDLTMEVMIDGSGTLRLPLAGAVPAGSHTLDGLTDAVRAALAGAVYEIHGGSGATLVPIRPEMVHLAMASWRPIHVYGDVVTPGEQIFRPGASVRSALAQAGGIGLAGAAGLPEPAEIAELVARTRKLEAALAQDSAIVTRLEAQLGASEGDDRAPDDALQAERLALARESQAAERTFLEETLALTDARLSLLSRQGTAQAEAVAADEAEVARAQDLRERGLAANDRVLEARRAQLLSSLRLLDTEGEEAAVSVRRADIAHDLANLETVRRADVLAELETARRRLAETRIDLEAARTQGALARLGGASETGPAPRAVIHRSGAGGVEALPVDLDAPLQPGDIVELRLVPSDADPAAPTRPSDAPPPS